MIENKSLELLIHSIRNVRLNILKYPIQEEEEEEDDDESDSASEEDDEKKDEEDNENDEKKLLRLKIIGKTVRKI